MNKVIFVNGFRNNLQLLLVPKMRNECACVLSSPPVNDLQLHPHRFLRRNGTLEVQECFEMHGLALMILSREIGNAFGIDCDSILDSSSSPGDAVIDILNCGNVDIELLT